MKRRALLVAGGLAAIPAARRAYAQGPTPLIGMVLHGTRATIGERVDALNDELRVLGYVDGRDYRSAVRWSENRPDALPVIAREVVRLKPAVIVVITVLAAQAVQRESKTVPIVIAVGSGAIKAGLAASLARPGGNVTGVVNEGDYLTEKQFELINAIAPKATRVGLLTSGRGRGVLYDDVVAGARKASAAFGMTLIELVAVNGDEVRGLSEQCRRERCEALVLPIDPFLQNLRTEILALVAELRLPCAYGYAAFAEHGGLISYSPDILAMTRRSAHQVVRILKGAKPADLPMERATRYDVVVNMRAAQALGIKFPPAILVQATKVIE